MIIGNIKDAKRYFGINKNFEKAFEFLKSLSKDAFAESFEGEGFHGGISVIERNMSEPVQEKRLEAHKKYLDIHFVIDGAEMIGYADIDTVTPETEYSEEKDVWFLKGEQQKFVLNEGDFCIVFPEDVHAPGTPVSKDGKLKKAVVKIKL